MSVPSSSAGGTSSSASAERARIARALRTGGTIDITTRGRQSGLERRIEIVFFNFGDRLYISGLPGRRGWYANLRHDPRLVLHLKHPVAADLPATAALITEPAARRPLLERITAVWNRQGQLERFVAASPLIEVTLDDTELLAAA